MKKIDNYSEFCFQNFQAADSPKYAKKKQILEQQHWLKSQNRPNKNLSIKIAL